MHTTATTVSGDRCFAMVLCKNELQAIHGAYHTNVVSQIVPYKLARSTSVIQGHALGDIGNEDESQSLRKIYYRML